MYCPECGAEYREGYDRCDDCNVSLTTEPPPEEDHSAEEYVEVFETSQADVIPVIKSILKGAKIPYNVRGGEGMMNLFPSDALGPIWEEGGSAEMVFKVPISRADRSPGPPRRAPRHPVAAGGAARGRVGSKIRQPRLA